MRTSVQDEPPSPYCSQLHAIVVRAPSNAASNPSIQPSVSLRTTSTLAGSSTSPSGLTRAAYRFPGPPSCKPIHATTWFAPSKATATPCGCQNESVVYGGLMKNPEGSL